MKRKMYQKSKVKKRKRRRSGHIAYPTGEVHHDIKYIHKHLDKLWEHVHGTNQRLQILETQVNLVSRLLTTLCIENFDMRLSEFRKLIRRIEKEAIADSEVRNLQDLFRMESRK